MSIENKLKEEIYSRESKDLQKDLRDSMPKLKDIMERFKSKEESFIETEFSRYKIKLTKGNFILISELKEEEAKSLYDKICQLT